MFLLCLGFLGYGQKHLDRYIEIGLENNEVIKQKNFDINKSLYALKEAQSLFSPNVAFVAGLFVLPLLLTGLGLRKAPDGRRVGLHMLEGIRHLRDELLGTHHECGGCDHDHGADRAGGCP